MTASDRPSFVRIGSLSKDDGDVRNENGKKAIGLDWPKTTLHVHHAFLYISLMSLHDYNVKIGFMEDVNKRQRLPFSFPELPYVF